MNIFTPYDMTVEAAFRAYLAVDRCRRWVERVGALAVILIASGNIDKASERFDDWGKREEARAENRCRLAFRIITGHDIDDGPYA